MFVWGRAYIRKFKDTVDLVWKLVELQFRQWLNFEGQNDSIFSLVARKEQLSHFDLKIWVEIFSVSNSTFEVKMTHFYLSVHWTKKLVILT